MISKKIRANRSPEVTLNETHRTLFHVMRWGGWLFWPLAGLGVGLRYVWQQYQTLVNGTGEGRAIAFIYLYPFWMAICVAALVAGLLTATVLFRLLRPSTPAQTPDVDPR